VDLAEVEEPPAQPSDALRLKRRRSEQMIDVDTLESEQAGDRYLWVILSERGAYLCARCREQAFGGDHVRATAQNIDGLIVAGNVRDCRNRSRARQLCRVSAWLIGHQYVQPVELGFEAGDEQRDRASRLREKRFGLCHLEIAGVPVREPKPDEREQVLVGCDLFASERESRLKAANKEIRVRRFRCDGDPGADTRCLRGLRFRSGGLGTASEAAEKIDLPARAHADVVERDAAIEGWRLAGDRTGRTLEGLTNGRDLDGRIRSRQKCRAGSSCCCPRLIDACECSREVEILF